MSWRLAKSLETLRAQINEAFPKRSKVSDGSIGDVSHSARKSDHNPNGAGVVTAIDVTNDTLSEGLAGQKLVDAIYRAKDKRIKYLIFNKKITVQPFGSGWKNYHGGNAHEHHVHISVSSDAKLYDDAEAWNLSFGAAGAVNPSEPKTYTVKAGDTVGKILKRFNLSMTGFYQLNNFDADIFDADKIQIGQVFRVR